MSVTARSENTENTTWEKSAELAEKLSPRLSQQRIYMLMGFGLIAVVGFLLVQGTIFGGSYYMTVEELQNDPDMVGKSVRVAAAVDGDYELIVDKELGYDFDQQTHTITFYVVHIPNDTDDIRKAGGISKVLHDAVNNEELPRLKVVYQGEPPELLKDEAQAIMQGKLGEDGVFYAESLQLKCPTKYEDENPERVSSEVK